MNQIGKINRLSLGVLGIAGLSFWLLSTQTAWAADNDTATANTTAQQDFNDDRSKLKTDWQGVKTGRETLSQDKTTFKQDLHKFRQDRKAGLDVKQDKQALKDQRLKIHTDRTDLRKDYKLVHTDRRDLRKDYKKNYPDLHKDYKDLRPKKQAWHQYQHRK